MHISLVWHFGLAIVWPETELIKKALMVLHSTAHEWKFQWAHEHRKCIDWIDFFVMPIYFPINSIVNAQCSIFNPVNFFSCCGSNIHFEERKKNWCDKSEDECIDSEWIQLISNKNGYEWKTKNAQRMDLHSQRRGGWRRKRREPRIVSDWLTGWCMHLRYTHIKPQMSCTFSAHCF